MAKFQFRLETLRKIRIAHRDEVRAKLAEAFQASQLLEERRQAVEDELAAMQVFQREAASREQSNVNSLMESQRYQAVIRAEQQTIQEQSKQLEAEIEKRRLVVVEADREVRVLDKLEERKLQQFKQHQNRTEIKLLDDVASQRFRGER